MNDVNSIKKLLEKITDVHINDISERKNEYNIFHVLGIEHREVLICRFLGNLLDPKGSHGMGIIPLKAFIGGVIGEEVADKELSNAVILLEEHIDDDRRVDIVIHLSNKIYPIEVKIWAGDQECQLQDYYKYFFGNDENHKIYYLTPFGSFTSEKSRGKLKKDEQIVCLSFKENIHDWLNEINKINNEAGSSEVKFVIKNFMEVIENMCASNKEENDILRALSLDNEYQESDLIKSAIILMKHSDNIWAVIRKKYLLSKLDCWGDKYDWKECDDNDKKIDKHALFRIIEKSDEKKTPIAWICVDTNLYITAAGKASDWSDYPGGNYRWKYIIPKGYKGNKFALNKPTTLPENKICIKDILDEISNA